MLDIYPWQSEQWAHLMKMQQQARLPHAILLSGPEGIGLYQFALTFAQQALCLHPGETQGAACGKCQACELFNAGSHPDIKLIEPEEKGKQLKINQIRDLIDYVSLKSFSGQRKIAILTPADAMNRATANALLKTLEEPPEQAMLLLLSHRPNALPITIRSRCQNLAFKATYDKSALDWLAKHHPSEHDHELLLRLCQGGPLLIPELIESDYLEQRSSILSDLKKMSRDQVDVVQMASRWQSIGCENTLLTLTRLTQDLIKLKVSKNAPSLLNIDIKQDLQVLIKSLDLNTLIRQHDFMMAKYKESVGPMNFNDLCLLEEVIIHWTQAEAA